MNQYLADTPLAELLPSSIKDDPSLAAAAAACQPELSAIVAETPRVLVYHNLEGLSDAVLDLVAWGWHVDGYDLLATRAERLHVVRNFFDYHRFKGTRRGFELYFGTFLKRSLLAASPPHKSFLGASLTASERAAFEAPHPEVRVYPFRHAGTKQGSYPVDFLGAFWPLRSDALLRIGDRVCLFDPLTGEEAALDRLETSRDTVPGMAVARTPVRLPGRAGRGLFSGLFMAGFTVNQGAASRLYELDLAVGYQDEIERRLPLSARPGLEPLRLGSDTVSSPGAASPFAFFPGNRWTDVYPERGGRTLSGVFPASSRAGDRIYRRTRLFDPSRVVFPRSASGTFAGAFRLGQLPPHTAEIAVDMVRPAPARAMFCGSFPGVHGCSLGAGEWVELMCRVGRMAARFSDKVLVSITNRKPVRASSGVRAGEVRAGEYRLEVKQ